MLKSNETVLFSEKYVLIHKSLFERILEAHIKGSEGAVPKKTLFFLFSLLTQPAEKEKNTSDVGFVRDYKLPFSISKAAAWLEKNNILVDRGDRYFRFQPVTMTPDNIFNDFKDARGIKHDNVFNAALVLELTKWFFKDEVKKSEWARNEVRSAWETLTRYKEKKCPYFQAALAICGPNSYNDDETKLKVVTQGKNYVLIDRYFFRYIVSVCYNNADKDDVVVPESRKVANGVGLVLLLDLLQHVDSYNYCSIKAKTIIERNITSKNSFTKAMAALCDTGIIEKHEYDRKYKFHSYYKVDFSILDMDIRWDEKRGTWFNL